MRFTKKRGIALVIVLLIVVMLAIVTTVWYKKTTDVYVIESNDVFARKSEFFTRGAYQLFLLKFSILPSDFYDAVRFYKGIKSEDQVTDLTKFWEYVPGVTFSASGTQRVPDYLYAYLADLKILKDNDDPFEATAEVISAYLLGQKSVMRNESLFVRVYGWLNDKGKKFDQWYVYTTKVNWVIKKN